MKKIITSMILLSLMAASFGQQTLTKEDYLKKSANKRHAGWLMLVGGTLVGLIGAALPSDQIGPSNEGAVMILAGTASMLGSIPFFISSGVNRRKAARVSASLEMQKMNTRELFGSNTNPGQVNGPSAGMHVHYFPALSVKVDLASGPHRSPSW